MSNTSNSYPGVLTFYSGKGGAGKTTIAYNLGRELMAAGKKVLFVDWDGGQASLSALAGINVAELQYGIYEALQESILSGVPDTRSPQFRQMLAKIVKCVRWLGAEKKSAILANNLELAALESDLADFPGREHVLGQFLSFFAPRFDYILIDPPPSRGLLTVNALTAAHWLIIPVVPSSLDFQSLASMLSHPKFLPRITGRNWGEEMRRLALDSSIWYKLTPFRQAAEQQAQLDCSASDAEETGEFLKGFEYHPLKTELRYPNPGLKIVAVIPNMYEPGIADSREVLQKLSAIFGPLPARETVLTGEAAGSAGRYLAPQGQGILMPPIPFSGTYRRGYGQRLAGSAGEQRYEPALAAHELDRRQKPAWNYIVEYLIDRTGRDFQKKELGDAI
ncbi:MAG TPA: ParA family protein [Chloroflexia bacterium]|nr:ParA family protein [Chloroflexia bacterium]